VLKAGVWYLVARASAAQVRTYRVSGIQALESTGAAFERPGDFDLAAWWQSSLRRFESELYRDQAVLRVSPKGLHALRQFNTVQAQAAEASAGPPDGAGWRRVTLPIESIMHGASQVLRLGEDAKVLRPAALKREVLRRIDAVARLYRAGGGAVTSPRPR